MTREENQIADLIVEYEFKHAAFHHEYDLLIKNLTEKLAECQKIESITTLKTKLKDIEMILIGSVKRTSDL